MCQTTGHHPCCSEPTTWTCGNQTCRLLLHNNHKTCSYTCHTCYLHSLDIRPPSPASSAPRYPQMFVLDEPSKSILEGIRIATEGLAMNSNEKGKGVIRPKLSVLEPGRLYDRLGVLRLEDNGSLGGSSRMQQSAPTSVNTPSIQSTYPLGYDHNMYGYNAAPTFAELCRRSKFMARHPSRILPDPRGPFAAAPLATSCSEPDEYTCMSDYYKPYEYPPTPDFYRERRSDGGQSSGLESEVETQEPPASAYEIVNAYSNRLYEQNQHQQQHQHQQQQQIVESPPDSSYTYNPPSNTSQYYNNTNHTYGYYQPTHYGGNQAGQASTLATTTIVPEHHPPHQNLLVPLPESKCLLPSLLVLPDSSYTYDSPSTSTSQSNPTDHNSNKYHQQTYHHHHHHAEQSSISDTVVFESPPDQKVVGLLLESSGTNPDLSTTPSNATDIPDIEVGNVELGGGDDNGRRRSKRTRRQVSYTYQDEDPAAPPKKRKRVAMAKKKKRVEQRADNDDDENGGDSVLTESTVAGVAQEGNSSGVMEESMVDTEVEYFEEAGEEVRSIAAENRIKSKGAVQTVIR